MPTSYVMGLDLGPPGEPTGFAVLERADLDMQEPQYRLRHIGRFPPGTPYPVIVETVAVRAKTAELLDSPMIVDCTAVGQVVLDRLRRAQPARNVIAVLIGAGHSLQLAEGIGWMVPKKDLVSTLQMVLQTRRFKVAPDLADARLLATELANFRLRHVPISDTATAEWREGRHDDLVLAVALTCWYAERFGPRPGGSYVEGPLVVWPDDDSFVRANGEVDLWPD
jgi:hypothetical protein